MSPNKSISVFFDTEFTRFNSEYDSARLISIGCVAMDGREFYAELLDTWSIGMCSDFVRDTVLPLLDNQNFIKEEELARQLKAWTESLGEAEVIFRSDCPYYDWAFVEELFKFYGWPRNLRRKGGTIYFDIESMQRRYNAGLEAYWRDHGARQHHALVDARSLRFAWQFAVKRRGK